MSLRLSVLEAAWAGSRSGGTKEAIMGMRSLVRARCAPLRAMPARRNDNSYAGEELIQDAGDALGGETLALVFPGRDDLFECAFEFADIGFDLLGDEGNDVGGEADFGPG